MRRDETGLGFRFQVAVLDPIFSGGGNVDRVPDPVRVFAFHHNVSPVVQREVAPFLG